MTYQIIEKLAGTIIATHDGIEAPDAAAAIARIEARYKAKPVALSGKDGQVQQHTWVGREFEARSLKMTLS